MQSHFSYFKKISVALLMAASSISFLSAPAHAQTTPPFATCPEASVAMQLPEPQTNFTSNISEYFLANGYVYTASTNTQNQPTAWDKEVITVSKADPKTGQVVASQQYAGVYPFEHPLDQKVYEYTGRPFKHEFVVTSDDKAFLYKKVEGGGNIAVFIFDLTVPSGKNNSGVKIVEMPNSENLEANGLAVDQHDAIYLQMSSKYSVMENRHDRIVKLDKDGSLIATVLDIQHDSSNAPEAYLNDFVVSPSTGSVYTLTLDQYVYPSSFNVVRKYIQTGNTYDEQKKDFIPDKHIFHSLAVDEVNNKYYVIPITDDLAHPSRTLVMYDQFTQLRYDFLLPTDITPNTAYFEKTGEKVYLNMVPPYDPHEGTRSYLIQNGHMTAILPDTCRTPTLERVLSDQQGNIFFAAHPQDALWPNMQMGVIFKNPTPTPTVEVTATPTPSPTATPTVMATATPTVLTTSTPQPTLTPGPIMRPRVTLSPGNSGRW